MTRLDILQFMRENRYAVQASVSATGAPQAAVVGFVVTDSFELFFDCLSTHRKAVNLRGNPKVAFVIGGSTPGQERTLQLDGIADEPAGADLERLQKLYFSAFPDGVHRQNLPGIAYFRVRPTWIRFSDYSSQPNKIVQFSFPA